MAGQLTSEKYPSGRTVSLNYYDNGRLSNIADASRNYLNNLQYQGNGNTLNSMSLGNGTTQTFGFNDRLQMTNQTLSRSSEILQKYEYGYGQIDSNGNLDTTKNNGQLSQIESYIGTNKQWTQKFSYDSIGRLSESKEYRGDTNALSYKQKFDFDRFGNLYRKSANNSTSGQENPLLYTPIEDADIDRTTNRFTTSTGTTYNEAGQVVTDNKFRTMSFGYDANGRMVKATKASFPDDLSIYDALGKRVATKVNDVWQFTIYDAFGKLVAEYGGLTPSDEGGVKYVLSDWQGSVRGVLSNAGFVQSRTDYQAFGEEVNSGVGLRTVAQGFGSQINNRQGYGLTEKDDSTGLNHTTFRKNENRAGRWTSPDPYNGSMSLGNPQSFNRYSYVENEPTNFVDPSGLLRIQQCTRTWVDYGDGSGRHYSGWTCVTIFDDGGGIGSGSETNSNDPEYEECVKKAHSYYQKNAPPKPTEEQVKAFLKDLNRAINEFEIAVEKANKDFWRVTKKIAGLAIIGGIVGAYKGGRIGGLKGIIAGALLGAIWEVFWEADKRGVDIADEKAELKRKIGYAYEDHPAVSKYTTWGEQYKQELGECKAEYILRQRVRPRRL